MQASISLGVCSDFCFAELETRGSCVQARERPATLATGLFDDLDAPELLQKFGGAWPHDCIARAVQSPLTDKWGQQRPLQVRTCHVVPPVPKTEFISESLIQQLIMMCRVLLHRPVPPAVASAGPSAWSG